MACAVLRLRSAHLEQVFPLPTNVGAIGIGERAHYTRKSV